MSVSDAAHRANQNQTSLDSLPACTMNLFLGPRARGGAASAEEVGACGSGNKTEVTSDSMPKTQKKGLFVFSKKKKKCFIYKYIISSNLQLQITTCFIGMDTSKRLKTKYVNPRVKRLTKFRV